MFDPRIITKKIVFPVSESVTIERFKRYQVQSVFGSND